VTADVHATVADADVLYTDVWTSMGQEAENQRRRRDLSGYGPQSAVFEQAENRLHTQKALLALIIR
jgi:ornithine carbamoyltransferase